MIEIDKTLVSTELFEKKFVCDLAACKGACCIEGDTGAPVSVDEIEILERIYDDVLPYMAPAGIEAIEAQDKYVLGEDGEFETPLVNQKECAYVFFDDNEVAKCAIEAAYIDGKVDFKKPVSCHLYPVRVTEYKRFDAVNFHDWNICEAACRCGEKLEVQLFRFLKDPLIRKFGEEWYEKMCEADKLLSNKQNS
ncbi:MAG: DUF3109 family protein [Flavobacteriales bacterium]|nr:DUF3109 family protein [Flavobacteriales bacterium]MBT6745304.1 DUF3109 family protein [Flavobacteriales bacterium]